MDFHEVVEQHYKAIFASLIIICAASVLAILYIAVISPIIDNLTKPSIISISVAPANASVTIDGKEYRNGSYQLEPGSYQATISAEGFESKTVKFTLDQHSTAEIANYLVNSELGLSYYERSATDMTTLQNITPKDSALTEFLNDYNDKASIRDILPYYWYATETTSSSSSVSNQPYVELYDGSYNVDCQRAYCIIAKGSKNPEHLDAAFSEAGYNRSDYEVIYED